MDDSTLGQIVTLLVAVVGAIGTGVVAYFQYRATQKQKADEKTAAAEKRAAEAEKKLADEQHQAEIQAINDKFTNVNKRLGSVADGIKLINECVDRMHVKISSRTADLEGRLTQVVALLSRYAQTYSALVQYYEKTAVKLNGLTEVENANLKYTVAGMDAITSLAALLRDMCHEMGRKEDVEEIIQISRDIKEVRKSFVGCMVENGMRDKELADIQAGISQTLEATPVTHQQAALGAKYAEHDAELETIIEELARGAAVIIKELED